MIIKYYLQLKINIEKYNKKYSKKWNQKITRIGIITNGKKNYLKR